MANELDARLRPFNRKLEQATRRMDRLTENTKRLTRAMAKAGEPYGRDEADWQADMEERAAVRFLCTKDGHPAIYDDDGNEVGYPQRQAELLARQQQADLRRSDRIAYWATTFAVVWIVGVSLAVRAGVIG